MLGLGIDIGTSGVRTAIVDLAGNMLSFARVAHARQDPEKIDARFWWQAVTECLGKQVNALAEIGVDPHEIMHAAIDGTSGTMVLVDDRLEPATPALMYDSTGLYDEAAAIFDHAEATSIALDANSGLARMLRLQTMDKEGDARHLLHQADYILAKCVGRPSGSDDNNALKTGFDPENEMWPDWLNDIGVRKSLLPEVRRVGSPVGVITPELAECFALNRKLTFHAGTTDSIAAFLATDATNIGDAVTSLGTTLAVKQLTATRITDASRGVYSHRLGAKWLAGGASNTGGGVLAAYFSSEEIDALSALINPAHPTGLDYYPLLKPGERFPINDPELMPRLAPRPSEPHLFLQAMLEGIASIEAAAFRALDELGAPAPTRIFTAGGGARNDVWTEIRKRKIPAEFIKCKHTEAAVGVAKLALHNTVFWL